MALWCGRHERDLIAGVGKRERERERVKARRRGGGVDMAFVRG